MQRFASLLLLVFFSSYIVAQEPLPKGFTDYEFTIWDEYLKNLPNDKGTSPPDEAPRSVAEWEEMQGVIVTWAAYSSNLREIIRNAKEYVKVYVVCSSQTNVESYLTSGGVTLDNIEFIVAPFNSVWVRDYGPHCVYLNGTNELAIVDWVYNRPRPQDDEIPSVVATHLNLPLYQITSSPNRLVATGGNFMSDGASTGFSSKLILEENDGLNENDINQIIYKYMGIDPYIKMNTLPYDGIHHIDMHMKLLDEETLLVGQYPQGISDGPQIESNLSYVLSNYKTIYGTDFRVVRIPMPSDEYGHYPSQGSDYLTYTNSVILNGLVLVPIYGRPQDSEALEIYRNAMPGYNVVGLDMRNVIPASGAIHCITKEIAAADPILISHAPLRDGISYNEEGYEVLASITSSAEIENATLFWSSDTAAGFQEISMILEQEAYTATLPALEVGAKVFYYIAATNANEKTITKPIVAPKGLYVFTVEQAVSVSEVDFLNRVSVFPNPATNELKVGFSGYVFVEQVLILNPLGSVVWAEKVHSETENYTVNVSSLPSGYYFMVIKSKNQAVTRGFVKR
ncbi:MAG TPA: agmatine deiminase family protein [Tenuifilaceae bacterium]|nr:agmatine deiminase family protein [Tenuifilaceae bacterium]